MDFGGKFDSLSKFILISTYTTLKEKPRLSEKIPRNSVLLCSVLENLLSPCSLGVKLSWSRFSVQSIPM